MAFLKIFTQVGSPLPAARARAHGLRFFCLMSILAFCILINYSYGLSEPVVSSVRELKTAFLYQFTKYVTWPKAKKNTKKLYIGVAADPDMTDAVSRLDGRLSQGKIIVVVPLEEISRLEKLDVLYLGKGYLADEDIVDKAIKYHILTVSDEEDAPKKGIIIGLYMKESRLRFDINLKVAKKSDLKLSSRLLKLAGNLIK